LAGRDLGAVGRHPVQADLVLRKLKQADGRGRVAVVDALSEIAKLFIAGALGKEDAAEGEE